MGVGGRTRKGKERGLCLKEGFISVDQMLMFTTTFTSSMYALRCVA